MNRLLQINSVINSGSTGRIAEEIGEQAIAFGWESYIAYGRNDRPSKSRKIKIGKDFDIIWHGLKSYLLDKHGFASKNATRKLILQIEKIEPDIIHLHNLHGYYINIELLFNYLKKKNIPLVWTLHDCWAITGHCSHFSYVNCDKWKILCNHCPQRHVYPSSLFLDRSKYNFTKKKEYFTSVDKIVIVPVSDWLASIVQNSFLNSYQLKTIYNGIDINIFSPKDTSYVKKKYNIEQRFIILGVASIWSNRKGLEDFIQLSKHLKKNEVIILVGLKKNIIKMLPSNIIGISHTSNLMELAELYSVANLFLNPTWEDNFPTTNLEALACGTPVITYRTGGSIEAISKNTGFIIDKGDINAILNIIRIIKSKDKDYYKEICRQRAVDYFQKEDRYAEYIMLYTNLLYGEKNNENTTI